VKKYLKDNQLTTDNKNDEIEEEKIVRKKICYCRVSSHGQSKELENQIEFMKLKYPDYELLTDIGSGINFKRKNLLKIIDYAINNQLEELVIAYKDRLCRIAYDLLDLIFKKYSNTKIIVVNDDENKSPEKEVTEDLIQIITCFSARLYGMRNYINDIDEGKKKP
jgi:putative resolvase